MTELAGSTLGEVFPPKSAPVQLPSDCRREALLAWREYMAREVVFLREMGKGLPPAPFRIPIEQILLEQPDDPTTMQFPSIAVLPASGTIEPIALGAAFHLEETRDQFGEGTVLVHKGEYMEDLTIELWADTRTERRALVAAFKRAMRQSEDSWSLRIKVPRYYCQVVQFTLQRVQYIDDADAIRNRRKAQAVVELHCVDLERINYRPMIPLAESVVEDLTAADV